MARPLKQGLDYFPLDVTLDDSVALIEATHGLIGFGVLIKMYQKIYSEGYYYDWTEKEQLLFSRRIHLPVNDVKNVINDCIKWGLFNQKLFEKYQILTSKGIQERYLSATNKRKSVEMRVEYILININDYNNLTVKGLMSDEMELMEEETTQSKVKESKVKKSKEYYHHQKDDDSDSPADASPSSDNSEAIITNQGESVSIFSFVEDQFARPLKKAECALLEFFLQEYPKELIQEAVSRAVLNQATNIKYVQSILVSWSNKGIKTLSEVHEEDKRFQKAKKSKLKKFNPKGKDAKLCASKTSRASPDSDKIPDYYKIYAQRDKQRNTGG
jgi:DnaD/phage-associated family protein